MTEQFVRAGGSTSLIYKQSCKGLCIGSDFKQLRAIFITEEVYTLGVHIPDNDLPNKIATSIYHSIPNPKQGCEYLSWQQVSPPDRATFGLSWVIVADHFNAPDPREVIQFLTSQLSYKIEWRMTAIRDVDCPSKITFVLPKTTVGYEPWDIDGNRIMFDVPTRRGEVTEGCFVVPGQYGQFVISAPDRNVVMDLRVTGYLNPPDKYATDGNVPRTFYVRVNGVRVPAYTNSIDNPFLGTIRRTVTPLFATLNDLIREEYMSHPFFPCFPPLTGGNLTQQVGPVNGTTTLVRLFSPPILTGERNWVGPDDRSVCGGDKGYVVPKVDTITLAPGSTVRIASNAGSNSPQFLLSAGESFLLKISLKYSTDPIPKSLSPSLEDYSVIFGIPSSGASPTPVLSCSPGSLSLVLVRDSDDQPQEYNPIFSDPLEPGADGGKIAVRVELGAFVGTDIDVHRQLVVPEGEYQYVFTTPNNGQVIP